MMEMAETASSSVLDRLSVSSEEGSLRGSREKLLASPEVCVCNERRVDIRVGAAGTRGGGQRSMYVQ